jgi:hypothetical protein
MPCPVTPGGRKAQARPAGRQSGGFTLATEKARYLFGAAANHGNLPDQLDEGLAL